MLMMMEMMTMDVLACAAYDSFFHPVAQSVPSPDFYRSGVEFSAALIRKLRLCSKHKRDSHAQGPRHDSIVVEVSILNLTARSPVEIQAWMSTKGHVIRPSAVARDRSFFRTHSYLSLMSRSSA